MSIEVKVPALGESIVEATIGRWLKQEGDTVDAGDALVELETDKVNMEVAATDGGVLQSIAKHEGDTVEIGDVLAVIDQAPASASGDGKATPAETEQSPAAAQQAREPEAVQSVRQDAPSGEMTPAPGTPATPSQPTETPQPVDEEAGARSTPLARRIAAENGIDINRIPGSGPSGRVTRDDVAAYLAQGEQAATQPSAAPAPRAPVETGTGTEGRPEERVRMSRRRQTIARRLVEAQHTAAMLTTFNEVDMTAIMDLRKRRRDEFKARFGVGLGFMSFFTRASIGALKDFPRFNAEIQGDEMILKRYYDIGIAVSTDEGLVVPVVRDADTLSFAEIERQIAALAERARTGQLSLTELQGGTFTITNGGVFGSLLSTPILNTPQVGILGLHKIEERPMAMSGQVVIRPMMYLALSYDHRIVDGAEAVRFLVRIKELIEDPGLLLVES